MKIENMRLVRTKLLMSRAKVLGFISGLFGLVVIFSPHTAEAASYCASLRSPLDGNTTITATHKNNEGIDLQATSGTPVYSAANGFVVSARVPKYNAKKPSRLVIMHDNGLRTEYQQLRAFTVKNGQFVKKGQLIGYVGGGAKDKGSFRSTGAHLHFGVFKTVEDTRAYLSPTCVVR